MRYRAIIFTFISFFSSLQVVKQGLGNCILLYSFDFLLDLLVLLRQLISLVVYVIVVFITRPILCSLIELTPRIRKQNSGASNRKNKKNKKNFLVKYFYEEQL